jgi:hypothetical protein
MGAPIGNCNAGKGITCSPGGDSGRRAAMKNSMYERNTGNSKVATAINPRVIVNAGIGTVKMKSSYKKQLIAKHVGGRTLPSSKSFKRDPETGHSKKFMARWQSMNNKS